MGTCQRGSSSPEIAVAAAASPLFVLCATQFVLQLDLSIVNLGLKSIQSGLGFSAAGLQWVATSYALTFGSLLMVGGRLGDVVGRRRLLTLGLVVFGAASLACGLADSKAVLVGSRFAQGAAGAVLAPTVVAMIATLYPDGHARARAMGIWAGALAAGGTTGLIAGGLLTDAFGWRSIFLVNLPIVAVLIVLARRALPESRGTTRRSLDVGGGTLLVLATASLIYGVTSGEQHGFGAPLTGAFLLLALVLGGAFVAHESRVDEPILPLSFLATPVRRISTLTMFVMGGLLAAYMYFIALGLQLVLGFDPAQAGLGLVPSGVVLFSTSFWISHRLIGRFGVKAALVTGIAAQVVGMIGMSRIGPGTAYPAGVLPFLVVNAFGIGLVLPTVSVGITGGARQEEMGVAAGLVPAAQQIGASVILAVLATVAAAVSRQHDGSLAAGYDTGFAIAAAIATLTGLLVATTTFPAPRQASRVGPAAARAPTAGRRR